MRRPKVNEFFYWEHIILVFKRISNYMGSQWNQLNAFKLRTGLPRNIINTKLQIWRRVKQQKNTHLMESSCYLLWAQLLHSFYKNNYKRQLVYMTIYNIKSPSYIFMVINNNFIIYNFFQEGNSMATIADLYSLKNSASTGGIEGYYVQKKYIDPMKIKEQRILSQSKDKLKSAKPVNVSKKTTFIDDVQKLSAKLPGPTTYEPALKQKSKSKTSDIVKYGDRKTFIDQISQYEKKRHIPGAGTYGKIDTQVDKAKLKPNLSKAETPTYLQASMRNSLQCPGVGNYNSYRPTLDHRGVKWVADPEKDKKKSIQKLPPVGTYNPRPMSYHLFESITEKQRKKMSSYMGGKTERFKLNSKDKKLPFYNILSEWGMKNKLQKKDIMSNVSSHPSSSRSLYY